uniref:Amino acid permease/ SLC12A domain-containing protein n=1 Tax=Physcomitrium patens TaxID=3218 RepID=A0A7I4BH50_PHYPA
MPLAPLLYVILIVAVQFVGLHIFEGDMSSDLTVKAVAIGCVVILTVWNCFGIHVGAKLQNIISVLKLLLISVLIVAAVVFVWDNPLVLEENFRKPFEGSNFSGFGVSCVAALWAFTGWGDLVFLTEEMKDPERDIPRGTVGGMTIVMIIYLLLNAIYLCILPAAVVKTSAVVAIDAADAALGPWAGSFMSILVAISLLGSANGIIICGARYLYAAARHGQIFKSIGAVGTQSRAPYVAHLLQGLLCILLLLQSSDFVELVSFFGVSSYIFYGLTGAVHIKLRRDLPTLHRPYRVAFYPYAPLVVICFSLYLVISALMAQPKATSLSLSFIIVSFPVYYLSKKSPLSSSLTNNS